MRYKVVCRFKGYHYAGWQIQKEAPTIQRVIQDTLFKITKSSIAIVGCSRTDAKVSAKDFVFHFDSLIEIEPESYRIALNRTLPDDIHALDVEIVDSSFHARHNSKSKVYSYTIEMGEYNVFEHEFVYQLNQSLDIELCKQALEIFVGTHDFSSFNTTPLHVTKNQIRIITFASLQQVGSKVIIEVHGNGFLHHMVRMIVQTIIEVGLHRINIKDVKAMLDAKSKQVCRYKAPAEGLCLERVSYAKKTD